MEGIRTEPKAQVKIKSATAIRHEREAKDQKTKEHSTDSMRERQRSGVVRGASQYPEQSQLCNRIENTSIKQERCMGGVRTIQYSMKESAVKNHDDNNNQKRNQPPKKTHTHTHITQKNSHRYNQFKAY
jgi:hypothetical protein